MEDLERLRRKYERMLALRRAHDRARNDPAYLEPNPTEELARLAEEFPGALREIDRHSVAVIEARIDALAAQRVEPWMTAQIHFHRLARAALAIKRWLAGRDLTPELRAACALDLCGFELAAIAKPPRGRVMDLVYARVAEEMAITPAEARALVFG